MAERPDNTGASPLTIQLFGPFAAFCHGQPLPRLRSRREQWLLALLVLRHGSPVDRAWLAGTLWPDATESQSLSNLPRNLSHLRRALGAEVDRLHSPAPHSLALDLSGAEVDLIAFELGVERGDPASLEEVVSLYRGRLLEECAVEWVLPERQLREQAYLQARETLAARALAAGDAGVAEGHLCCAVAIDRLAIPGFTRSRPVTWGGWSPCAATTRGPARS